MRSRVGNARVFGFKWRIRKTRYPTSANELKTVQSQYAGEASSDAINVNGRMKKGNSETGNGRNSVTEIPGSRSAEY